MTTSYRQGRDVWLYPIEVVAGVNDQIVWAETSDTLSITVEPGVYWCFNGSAPAPVGASTYLSLYNQIASQMSGASFLLGDNITYTFRAITPTGSVLQEGAGIALVGSTADFLSLNLTATTFDQRIFGFAASATGTVASVAAPSGSGREVQGPLTRWGAWVSPVEATSRTSTPRRLIEWATAYTEREDAYAVDYGARRTRVHSYEYVPAGHVRVARADDPQYADAAELYTGDTHNAFETVWESLAKLDEVVVIHHLEGDALDLAVTTHSYEVVRLADAAQAQDFSRVATVQRTAGEWYKLEVTTTPRRSADAY
jgi:hypothetical protein